jgi:multiple sugar transport system ATP-binding protein
MASVALRRVSKVFPRGVLALREVDLEVRDGEILVLLGPNGSGKTTLLRLIAGLDQPTSGEVWIGDQVVNHVAPRKRNVAMVFQACVLYPHLTVERNIVFGLDRWCGGWPARLWNRLAIRFGVPKSAKSQEIRDRVRHTAQLVGVEHLLDRFPRQLSGGERQRVALGRAFVRHPAVFLLDEPWSNVDDRLRQPLRHQLRQLCKQYGGTTILVTHDHLEALALGDRIAVLEAGRVHQIGAPAEIVANPQTRFAAEFVGSPPMNFVAGRLRRREGLVRFESGAWRIEWRESASQAVRDVTVRDLRIRDLRIRDAERDVWLAFRADAAMIGERPSADSSALRGVVVPGIVGGDVQVMIEQVQSKQEGIPGVPLIVRPASGARYSDGQEVWIVVDPRQIHFFDQQTGVKVEI